MKEAAHGSSALNRPNVAGYFLAATVLSLAILSLAHCEGRATGVRTAEPRNDRPHTPARVEEAAAAWASRLAKDYDGRGALTIKASRDPKSTAAAMIAWSAAAEGRTEKADALNLWLFVDQYSPIWNGSNVDKAVLAKLMGRLKLLERGQIQSWRTALRSVHGDDISEEWAAGILITVDPVFPPSGFDAKQSEALRARLSTLPPAAVASLATRLNTAKAIVAGKMIQQNALFSGSSFNQKYFDDSLKALDRVHHPEVEAERVGGDVREPKKLTDVNPVYPDAAKAAGLQGPVILDVTIGPGGRVTKVKVLRGEPILADAAVAAVKQWAYEPPLVNGIPAPVRLTVMLPVRPRK